MPKVFLSYAREDLEPVRKLRDFLRRSGIDTWWDKDDILPGRKWETEIETALAQCDFVAGCFSKVSVRKRGYVQRELKRAREFGSRMLEDDIYFIPVLLEECELPTSMEQYHAVKFFSPDGPRLLLEAIETGSRERQLGGPSPVAKPDEEPVDLSGLGAKGWFSRFLGHGKNK